MKPLARLRLLRSRLLKASLASVAVFFFALSSTNGQTITIDFRFDTNGGTNPTTAGATTLTLTAGSAGQTYLVDVFATVTGGSPASMNGIKDVLLRGISDIVTATPAFATGTGIGAVAQVTGPTASTTSFQYLPPLNAGGADANTAAFPVVKVSDLGSTNASQASNTTNSVVSATADGILDFGGTVASQVFAPLSFTNAAVFTGGTAVGTNGQSWEIGTFKFTTGTASTTAGATTLFYPAAAKGTGGGDISINGSPTTQNVPISIGTPLTFVVAGGTTGGSTTVSVTPTAAAAGVLKGGLINLGAKLNNTGTTGLNAGDYTFAASGGTNITYSAASPATGSTPIGAGANQAFTFGAQTSATTPIGAATVTFTANSAAGATTTISNAPQTGTMTLNVGNATADNSNSQTTFGAPLTAAIAANGSYQGLESQVVAASGAGTSAPLAGGAETATVLAGSNGTTGSQTMSMAWRARTTAEAAGGAVFDPSLSKPTTGLISDVVNLTGIETGGTGTTTTGPFVLDMSYNPALLPKGSTTNGHTTPSTLEGALAANKLIYMISLNPTTGLWDRAFAENTGNTVTSPTDPNYGFLGSFSAFATARFGTTTPTNAQLATLMGAWGVDTTAHEVWSILDHNSQFAVVPEPATLVMAGFGLLGLAALRRRVKMSA